ncbi:MAG: hypothetical protein GY812_05835 [Actinomycetia bacterium]|nr:hypothetical protein [Actinomycetes bacterium]
MNLYERVKARTLRLKPSIKSAYMPYLELAGSAHLQALSDTYDMQLVESSKDPLLAKLAPPWLQRIAGPMLDAGDWYAMAILHEGDVVGRVWMALRVPHGPVNGVMNVRLANDEAYGFDLYIEPEHRRGDISNFMAYHCINELQLRGVKVGYTHLDCDNAPSVFWHAGVGFNTIQSYSYLKIGDRIHWKIPLSDSPRWGPVSRRGRHSEAPDERVDPFGNALLPI